MIPKIARLNVVSVATLCSSVCPKLKTKFNQYNPKNTYCIFLVILHEVDTKRRISKRQLLQNGDYYKTAKLQICDLHKKRKYLNIIHKKSYRSIFILKYINLKMKSKLCTISWAPASIFFIFFRRNKRCHVYHDFAVTI